MAAKKKNNNNSENTPLPDEQENIETESPKVTENPNGEKTAEKQQDSQEDQGQAEDAAKTADNTNSEQERYLRLMAEYENFRKRSAKERENIYTDVRIDTVSKFLPVYDNLERALKTETADEAFKKGVEMTMLQLKEVMAKLGVEEIETIGGTFDPNLHNAVMHIEDEGFGEGEIVDEFQKGFKIGDRVIRFSMVKVAN